MCWSGNRPGRSWNACFQDCLRLLARLKEPVDRFFDHVMVMVEERALRENRLNLLCQARELFNRMADFSRLTPPD